LESIKQKSVTEQIPNFLNFSQHNFMTAIQIGAYVAIEGQGTVGEVVSIKGNNVEVAVGLLKFTVKKDKLVLAQPPAKQESEEVSYKETVSMIDTKEKMLHFQFELDVRGKMKDEAMLELQPWVDDAILLGIEEARVLHGRGNGLLKNTVRTTLRKYKEIESLADGAPHQGGESVTVVRFRN
jgi:DNA mismatch repair protein MutS2